MTSMEHPSVFRYDEEQTTAMVFDADEVNALLHAVVLAYSTSKVRCAAVDLDGPTAERFAVLKGRFEKAIQDFI